MWKNKNALSKIAAVLCFCLCIGTVICPTGALAYASDYDYLIQTSAENAYLFTGSDPTSGYCSMITSDDPSDLRYQTLTTENGVDSGYFGAAHYLDVKYDESFYQADDHMLIVSVMYYDYGPGQGSFYIKYYSTEGDLKTVTLIKPGTNPNWYANTAMISDIDLTRCFEDGAHVRVECSSGGKNAFKKVETVNVSKLKREGKFAEISCIGTSLDGNLRSLGFIDPNDTGYQARNLSKQITQYDLNRMTQRISGKTDSPLAADLKNHFVTQGEMLSAYFGVLGMTATGDAVEYADGVGLLSAEDLILNAEAPATYYNLIYLTYAALYYTGEQREKCLMSELLDSGYFSDEVIHGATDAKFTALFYSEPRKLPYTKISDQETGRTYYYVNFFGQEMRRTYMTHECWSEDGRGMIVGALAGRILNLFYYNIEEQTITFIDSDVVNYGEGVEGVVGCDNYVYYLKNIGSQKQIRRASLETFETEELYDIPAGVTISGFSISNDCRYLAFEYDEAYTEDKPYPKGSELGARLDLETGTWEVFHHNWEYQNRMMHVQINPVYTDLVFFCHDYANPRIGLLDDRIWTVNLSTGEQKNIFVQGRGLGKSMVTPTHETWSLNGEWLSFVSFGLSDQVLLYMIDKDGRHRRRFENPYGYFFKHTFASGDCKFLAADGHYMTILSTETEQYFKISRWKENGKNGSQADHPYHPHPIVARNQYKVSWGDNYNDVLGVYWYDFTEIAENEIAEGGHEPLNDSVTRISYKGLPCETEKSQIGGRDCYKIAKGNSMYLDIAKEVADDIDAGVTIAFDYYDKGYQPIVLTYTKGIKDPANFAFTENGQVSVKRRGSGRWIHKEIKIDSGNFENPGRYASDFKISGNTSDVYISNITIKGRD